LRACCAAANAGRAVTEPATDGEAGRRAPIFTAAWDLTVWLLQTVDNDAHNVLCRELARETLGLMDQVTFAVKNVDRELALQDADLGLIRLRLRLRLAAELGLLDDAQSEHGLRLTDAIGRQLGGWQRALRSPK